MCCRGLGTTTWIVSSFCISSPASDPDDSVTRMTTAATIYVSNCKCFSLDPRIGRRPRSQLLLKWDTRVFLHTTQSYCTVYRVCLNSSQLFTTPLSALVSGVPGSEFGAHFRSQRISFTSSSHTRLSLGFHGILQVEEVKGRSGGASWVLETGRRTRVPEYRTSIS